MTSYRLRQDFFSFTTAMTIGDADGQDRFRVEGTWLSTGVTLTDLATGDALVLQPEIFSLKTVWHVLRGGIEVATFESEGWLAQTFNLDVPGPNDFTIAQQSLMSFDVAFTRPEDGQVARAYAPGWLTTQIAIEVEPGQDDILIVACTAILLLLRRQS